MKWIPIKTTGGKEIPKRQRLMKYREDDQAPTLQCICGQMVYWPSFSYCPHCGQKLKW